MGVSSKPDSASLNMFSRLAQPVARSFSTSSSNNVSVAVMGAAGGIGQPLSMLLKLNPAVSKLALYDIVTDSLIKGMKGVEGVTECAYVESDVTEAKYFATPLVLGPSGIEKNLGLGTLTEFEQGLLAAAIPELIGSIKKGEEFVANNC